MLTAGGRWLLEGARFPHNQEVTCAVIAQEKTPNRYVEVSCRALPQRFFTLTLVDKTKGMETRQVMRFGSAVDTVGISQFAFAWCQDMVDFGRVPTDRRYAVFGFPDFYPAGGHNDLLGCVSSLMEAKTLIVNSILGLITDEHGDARERGDRFQVVDTFAMPWKTVVEVAAPGGQQTVARLAVWADQIKELKTP